MPRYDSFTLSALRRKVHQYYIRNKAPTAEKILSEVIGDTDMGLPKHLSVRTMRRLLNEIGFAFRKRKRNCALLERDDIIVWRRKYLRTIREMRKEKRAIYYRDETWVNAGHTKEKVWEDAFRKGLTTGLCAPSGKGGRLIVLHAGSENGFVDGASLVFRAKKTVTSDYHSEMDGPRFERWFKEQLLPNIEPRSVIVVDSASYHGVQLKKWPSTSSRKAEIQSWLTQKNIPWSNDQLKPELIQLVNQNKHRFSGYRIDALAKVAGHDIVRLPPYHCEFNPI
ncbi:uncharacterized protein LOC119382183 [Rhipicephalus sanguineus]|uniref:uncharacterized protein LOC119382183 n=1 Tax=Rhipicephalus sanguineus TaxID=34632 RepID=UPI001894ED28|nr:uncharacterized protein LOC119382183 [Rhipicephalus sanguineus]